MVIDYIILKLGIVSNGFAVNPRPESEIKQFFIIYFASFWILQVLFKICKKLCEVLILFLVEKNILSLSLLLSGLISFMLNTNYAKSYLRRIRPFVVRE